MAFILCLETSGEVCSVALAADGQLISLHERREKNIHAAAITLLIEQVLGEAGIQINQLDAVSVSKGPGSYTGLRVGVSTAKGLCYALNIPLIAVNTLYSMATGLNQTLPAHTLLCPMIDARRMEVFTAVFNETLAEIEETRGEVLTSESFDNLADKPLRFFGSGAFKMENFLVGKEKWQVIKDFSPSASYLIKPSFTHFANKLFEDVAYFNPFYLKDFVSTTPKKIS